MPQRPAKLPKKHNEKTLFMKLRQWWKVLIPVVTIVAVAVRSSLASSSNSVAELPAECNNLDLVRGISPTLATTVIFGEEHDDKRCHNSIAKCMKALSVNIPRQNILGLTEDSAYEDVISCQTASQFKFFDVTDTCKGWNAPEYKDLLPPLSKKLAVKFILETIDRLRSKYESYPANKRDAAFEKEFLKIVTDTKKNNENELKKLKSQKVSELQSLQKTQKNVNEKNHRYSKSVNIITSEAMIALCDNVLKSYPKPMSITQLGYQLINKLYEHKANEDKYLDDLNYVFGKPNRRLATVLKKESPHYEKLFTHAGEGHIKKTSELGAEQSKYVDELYNSLDSNADENPYSILSC